MKTHTLVIILGGGIGDAKKDTFPTAERMRFVQTHLERFRNVPLLLSGRQSGRNKGAATITEAKFMRRILLGFGLKRANVFLEERSLDTISNAVFSKPIVESHKDWKTILLVTSDWHMQRALWIFRTVFGKGFRFIPCPVPSETQTSRKLYEMFLLLVAKQMAGKLKASRDMEQALLRYHPFYSKSKEAQALLKEILRERKRLKI